MRDRMGIGRHGRIAAGFIACAMVLGGGGSPSPAAEMLVQLAFVVAVLAWLWWAGGEAPGISRPAMLRTAPPPLSPAGGSADLCVKG
ncbi:hypothetical protein K3165_09985 [Qipengyuania sp. 1XM1-15A]|uniref:hypothetical protein n=1 Tax=Qipengyuania xiamenensis TaxID=2867237 RepID=UPI001C86BBC9|nr:hypothetical protein [Qipengyuania xiamenensis]MBX7533251.1 hypothetical protein [Qipengyuania xiamenensis]